MHLPASAIPSLRSPSSAHILILLSRHSPSHGLTSISHPPLPVIQRARFGPVAPRPYRVSRIPITYCHPPLESGALPQRKHHHPNETTLTTPVTQRNAEMPPVQDKPSAPINVKLLLIGNSSVGKSSLLLRFSDEQWLPEDESSATIGVDFRVSAPSVWLPASVRAAKGRWCLRALRYQVHKMEVRGRKSN